MKKLLLLVLVGAGTVACGWPETRMEPVADYAARDKETVSGIPSFRAGANYMLTSSPDGATSFVCLDGSHRPATQVAPGARPAC